MQGVKGKTSKTDPRTFLAVSHLVQDIGQPSGSVRHVHERGSR